MNFFSRIINIELHKVYQFHPKCTITQGQQLICDYATMTYTVIDVETKVILQSGDIVLFHLEQSPIG